MFSLILLTAQIQPQDTPPTTPAASLPPEQAVASIDAKGVLSIGKPDGNRPAPPPKEPIQPKKDVGRVNDADQSSAEFPVSVAQDKTGPGDKIKELKEKRLVLLEKILNAAVRAYSDRSKITFGQVHQAQADLLAARLDLAEKKEDRIKICEEAVKMAEAVEKRVVDRFNKGDPDVGTTGIDVDRSQVYVLETRIALEKAKAAK